MVDNFESSFGAPSLIHTVQGRNFTSALFQALFHGVCGLLEITKTRTTPYRPCSNGQVERYNHTLRQLIQCYLKENNRWDEDLAYIHRSLFKGSDFCQLKLWYEEACKVLNSVERLLRYRQKTSFFPSGRYPTTKK